ncbi:MAG: hypothetical protein CVV44_17345 [Spirochaetae bacterium HGW-Spirochaetae-1]|jgi:hypothetical protein|nr:MAG: hypothetical protein CVV44_17345 [Spirochaetae bacterium HGW-Spirochaetae-1]
MKKCRYLILILIMLWGSALSPAGAGDKIRIMVLGFRSPLMDDVQDTYLREALLRLLAQKGFSVVPVMDLEAIQNGETAIPLRSMTVSQIRECAVKYNAAYVIYGDLETDGRGDGSSEIREGRPYVCTTFIYCAGDNTTARLTYKIAGRENWYLFFQDLAAELASMIEKSING